MADSSPPPLRALDDSMARGCAMGCLVQIVWIVIPLMVKSPATITLITWAILEWIVLGAIIAVERARGYKKSTIGMVITALISGSIVFLLTSACGTFHVI